MQHSNYTFLSSQTFRYSRYYCIWLLQILFVGHHYQHANEQHLKHLNAASRYKNEHDLNLQGLIRKNMQKRRDCRKSSNLDHRREFKKNMVDCIFLWSKQHTNPIVPIVLGQLANATTPDKACHRKCMIFLGVFSFHTAFLQALSIGSSTCGCTLSPLFMSSTYHNQTVT